MKRRLLYISNMAAPYQIKFCYALQEYFDAEFWFYVQLEHNRPDWWRIPLGDKCKILDGSVFIYGLNYFNPRLLKQVKHFKPEILILGGFNFPGHYILKRWAKKKNIRVVVYSERISFNWLSPLKKSIKMLYKTLTLRLFKDIDLLFAIGEDPSWQYINLFGFNPQKVVIMQYPQDIDRNLSHKLRRARIDATLIFPNRLDLSYNPLFALEVFNKAKELYPELKMKMNSIGELRSKCEEYVKRNGISSNVVFLDDIKAWDELPSIYERSDIAIFTATDSNGPNTLIECMASGTGVLLSKHIYNTEEYAINNVNCFRLELKHDDFLDALEKYLTVPHLLEKHGQKSKEMVENRSITATARLYHDVLNT